MVKIHSRCNLACTYCYVYEMADQSWKVKPTQISSTVIRKTAARIGEYAETHGLSDVRVILHGGEPLLVGPKTLGYIAEQMRLQVKPSTVLHLSLQTNGTLLSTGSLDVLADSGISVSVSVDGDEDDHDRRRRYRGGRGSYRTVAAGIELLRSARYRSLYRGVLCTIDLRNDPLRTYEALLAFSPPQMDFLLPHGNWTTPPPGRLKDASTPYADWLRSMFDHWYGSASRQPGVRIFTEIIHALLGGTPRSEVIGVEPTSIVVVETDGTIEQVDALKSAYSGAAATGLNVEENSFDDVAEHSAFASQIPGIEGLPNTCQACKLAVVCGGGYYPHRYQEQTGFNNPSVYCADLQALIGHIRNRIMSDLSKVRGDT
ncbi:FxsB family cyclophane-forming radical SAM/SPASM peptide maturase [Cryptosporangium japonicum]|uniref:FxsB family cyclophane-forming radical SAM/SPASM peptide maturase n=1 Tax=Cryptosporangium japonicum TaxID=80872 RepID=UPI0031E3011A